MCCSFLCIQFRQSSVSVVLNFNASLSDVAPFSPISLSVDLMRVEKEYLVVGCLLCVVSFFFTFKIEFLECCV